MSRKGKRIKRSYEKTASEIALADRTQFVLSSEKWREFNLALDSEPLEIPALRAIFSDPEVFEP